MRVFSKCAAVALPAVACLVAAGLNPTTQASADVATPVAERATAPAFLRAVTGRELAADLARATGGDAVKGAHQLITLDTSLLPQQGRSSTMGMTLDDAPVTVRIDHVTQDAKYTSWNGSLVGEAGYVSIAEADGVYRGYVSTPDGLFDISSAGGDQYWLTATAPFAAPVGDDREIVESPAAPAAASGAPASQSALSSAAGKKGGKKGKKGKRAGKSKVTIVFGYTKETLALAGGKAQVKAAAVLAVADTNLAFQNSGVRGKLKLKGIVKAKGKEKASQLANYLRLYKPRDGAFDNLLAARNRKRADLVHLFLSGKDGSFCGRGALPASPRQTNPAFSVAVSNLDCLSNLTPTHEIGHNVGADHNDYPGVTHYSKIKGAYGFSDPAHGFITVMSYFTQCSDVGVFCQNIPYYSSNKVLYNGLPTGSKKQNNARAINLVIPKVARYRR